MITLTGVRAESNAATFPVDLLHPDQNAVSFCCAGFYGRNDVIHLYEAGLKRVIGIDQDEAKLSEMHDIYPPSWVFRPGDIYTEAEAMGKKGFRFDVVTVDPWSEQIPHALQHLPTWLAVTKQVLVIGVSAIWFDHKKQPHTLEAFNQWVTESHWDRDAKLPAASRLIKRSEYRGGIFWAIFKIA